MQMNLKINLAFEGLDMLFKDYEEILVRYLWKEGVEPTGSGVLWKITSTELSMKGKTISRASVIFAANRFVEVGIWDYSTVTGKGGHSRRYFAKMTEKEMLRALIATANEKMGKLLSQK